MAKGGGALGWGAETKDVVPGPCGNVGGKCTSGREEVWFDRRNSHSLPEGGGKGGRCKAAEVANPRGGT